MHNASIEHVEDGNRTGIIGHRSSNGNGFVTRINCRVKWGKRTAEIC